MSYRVENIVRKGEIACYKQFLLFSQSFLQLYISLLHQNAALCGIGLSIMVNQEEIENAKKILKNFHFLKVTYFV